MRVGVLLLLLVALPAFAAKGGKAAGWAPSPNVTGGASGHGGGTNSRMQTFDSRNAPPLAPGRKVTPQDCSKPIVLDGGNLSCK
jgi:hypothetical protein